jgi:hypothetical protein
MTSIKFSHDSYNKFRSQEGIPQEAKLLQVFVVDRKDLSESFVEYDTLFWNEKEQVEYFDLPRGKLIVLLLESIHASGCTCWTTIRRWTPEKERYYKSMQGQRFKIEIVMDVKQ